VAALIGLTRTERGLSVRCVFDEKEYETGLKVADAESRFFWGLMREAQQTAGLGFPV
jgi:hypothetical protein